MSNEDVTEAVIEDFKGRREVGMKTYGRPLSPFTPLAEGEQSSLHAAYHEALDMAQYLKKQLMENREMAERLFRFVVPVLSDDYHERGELSWSDILEARYAVEFVLQGLGWRGLGE